MIFPTSFAWCVAAGTRGGWVPLVHGGTFAMSLSYVHSSVFLTHALLQDGRTNLRCHGWRHTW